MTADPDPDYSTLLLQWAQSVVVYVVRASTSLFAARGPLPELTLAAVVSTWGEQRSILGRSGNVAIGVGWRQHLEDL